MRIGVPASCCGWRSSIENEAGSKCPGKKKHDKASGPKASGSSKALRPLTEAAMRIFSDILPRYGYAFREKQAELAEHMLGAIARRGVTLAESGVGTGKTHAYLIAAVLAKRERLNDSWLRGVYPGQGWAESEYMPVVISTSSIALQKALVKDYIPELSRILREAGIIQAPLTAAVRKGKEHYICEKRLHRFYNTLDEKTRVLLKPLVDGSGCDLTEAHSLTPYMKRAICVQNQCGDGCPHTLNCRYLAYLRRANDPAVDFQITNHNYFLADVLHRAAGKCPLLPHYQLVIIDEAHKLLSAARSMYGLELTESELPELAQALHSLIQGQSGNARLHALSQKLAAQSEKLFRRLNEHIDAKNFDDEAERFPAVIDNDALRHMRSIRAISADITAACENGAVIPIDQKRRSKVLYRLRSAAERIASFQNHSRLICWLERRVEGEIRTDALRAIPKDLNERLHRDLWSKGVPIILTSGTLSAADNFARIKETLGLNLLPTHKLSGVSMPSAFDYKGNSLLYISKNIPFPNNKDGRYIAAVADEIERLVIASHGHAAVLFTSYNVMGKVFALLKSRDIPYPMFRLERGGTGAIERLKRSGNGILFASGAMWEGIDIPGDALSMLIIVKLPFPVPDPIGDYERTKCGDFETYRRQVVKPDMLIRLIQGDGRVIRCETDTGVVAILDCRAGEHGAYRAPVLAALPKRPVTNSIVTVHKFYHDVKSDAYFDFPRFKPAV